MKKFIACLLLDCGNAFPVIYNTDHIVSIEASDEEPVDGFQPYMVENVNGGGELLCGKALEEFIDSILYRGIKKPSRKVIKKVITKKAKRVSK